MNGGQELKSILKMGNYIEKLEPLLNSLKPIKIEQLVQQENYLSINQDKLFNLYKNTILQFIRNRD